MKDFYEYINEAFGDEFKATVPITMKYITGLRNRLSLLSPEEIEELQPQLVGLKEVMDRILN